MLLKQNALLVLKEYTCIKQSVLIIALPDITYKKAYIVWHVNKTVCLVQDKYAIYVIKIIFQWMVNALGIVNIAISN